MDLATLYFTLSPNAAALNGELLTIDGRPIRFLHPGILAHSQFSEVKLGPLLGPALRFAFELELFAPWRTRMLVVTIEVREREDANQRKGMVARQLIDHFGKEHCRPLYFYSCLSTNRGRARGFVSVCLRGSASLTIDPSPEDSGLRMVYDAKGFAMISERAQIPRYQRFVLLYALSLAYQEQLQSFITRFRKSLASTDDDALQQLREESVRFNALHYSDNPVLVGTIELRKAWRTLADSFSLRDTNQEFQDQLAAVTHIAALRNERQRIEQQQRDDQHAIAQRHRQHRIGVSLTLLGILLGLLSLLTLVTITPDKLAHFWQSWAHWIAGL